MTPDRNTRGPARPSTAASASARSAFPPARPVKWRRFDTPATVTAANMAVGRQRRRGVPQSLSSDSFALSDQECADVLRLMSQGSPKATATTAAAAATTPPAPCSACGAQPPPQLLDGFWEVHCEFQGSSGPEQCRTQGTVIAARCASRAAAEGCMTATLGEYPAQVGDSHEEGLYQVSQIGDDPPVFRAVSADTTEKWYITFCKARMHVDDATVVAEPLGVAPWRALYQPHHVVSP